MIGKILSLIGLAVAAFVVAPKTTSGSGSKGKAKEQPTPPADKKLGGFEFAEFYLNGAKPEQKLLTIVLLHAEGSDAAAALPVLSTLSRPARVLVPLGPIVTPTGRAYVPPTAQGLALRKALVEQAWALQAFLAAVISKFSVADDGRLVVVGLGTAGSMTTALGLEGGAWVRLAYGVGGTFSADWVPLAQEPHATAVRKLSYGDAIGFDKLAGSTAAERGIDYLFIYEADVDPIDGVLDVATMQGWLIPLLEQDLGKG